MRNVIYCVGSCSNTLGSVKSRWSRGSGRGGASSAARNAFQRAASSPKCWRSGKASWARSSALSSTNSLTERREACAAAFSTRFASGVRRKSSFSDLVALAMMTSPAPYLARPACFVMTLSGARGILKSQAPISPKLPGHRSTLDDARHLTTEPVLDHRPPRHQRKFVGVLDQRKLAARELDGLFEDALHRLAIAGGPKRQGPRGSECGAGADDIALFERGEQVATVEDAAIGMTGGVALPDQMLTATIHGLLHVLPEASRDQIGGTASDEPPIEPGRALSLDLAFKIEDRKDASVDLAISPGIIGRGPALKIFGEPPVIGVDPLDDPSPTQRLEPADMGVDEAVMVAAGNAAVESGLLQMAARLIDAVLRHTGNGAVGRTAADLSRSDLDDAADADVLDSSRIDAGNVVGATINAIDDEGQVFAQLVGEMLVDNAADDRRRGRAVVNPEARRIALKAFRPQCLVHGLDDIAALAHRAQGGLQLFAQLPTARRGLAGKPHSLQLAKPRQPQRAVGDAARIGRRVPEVNKTIAGLGDQRPIDAGEAIPIDLGRELAPLLDFGDRTEFERHQFACPLANAMGDVVAIDDQILAQFVPAVDDDMNMRMAGIEMVHRHPIELRSRVSFEFAHEVAGEAGQVSELRALLRRDDDAKLVAVVLAAIEEGVAVGPVLRRRIEPAALAIARGAVALNITQMSGGAAVLAGGTDGT